MQITIRNVPDEVRNELAARAALAGKSMQEYILGELQRLASRPSVESWLEAVRRRKSAAPRTLSADQILAQRDADRG